MNESGTAVRSRDAAKGPGQGDPKSILQELQRLKAQKARLRDELAEREQRLRLHEQEQAAQSWQEDTYAGTRQEIVRGQVLSSLANQYWTNPHTECNRS